MKGLNNMSNNLNCCCSRTNLQSCNSQDDTDQIHKDIKDLKNQITLLKKELYDRKIE